MSWEDTKHRWFQYLADVNEPSVRTRIPVRVVGLATGQIVIVRRGK